MLGLDLSGRRPPGKLMDGDRGRGVSRCERGGGRSDAGPAEADDWLLDPRRDTNQEESDD